MKSIEPGEMSRVDVSMFFRVLGLVVATGRIRVLALLTLTIITGVLPGMQVLITARAVQAATDGPLDVPEVAFWVALFVLAYGLLHLLGTAVEYIGQIVQLRLAFDISGRVMAKGAQLELPDFEQPDVYDMLQRAFQEASGAQVHQLFNQSITVLRQAATLMSVSVVIVAWNPLIALLLLLSTIPAASAQLKLGKALYAIEFERTELRRRMLYYQTLTTQRQSVREIKVLGLGELLVDRFRTFMERFLRQDSSVTKRYMSIYGAWGLLSVLVAGCAIGLALHDVSHSGNVGQLAGYFQAMTAIQVAAASMFSAMSDIVESGLFVGNLFRLLDTEPTRIDPAHEHLEISASHRPTTVDHKPGRSRTEPPDVLFENVSFTYPGATTPALSDISFHIRSGETIAIVGPNGSGKSTVMNLLLRLYKPGSGSIRVDGHDTDSISRDAHLARTRAMLQDFVKYQLTVRDNVGFGDRNALDDDDRIDRALVTSDSHLASAQQPVHDLQLGKLFSEGIDLSGGEWQRIALARAVFGAGDLVLLDEPASALDPLAEEALFDGLTASFGPATKIFVSHRFSTVRRADRIVVLDNGRVAECGTHEQLLEADGLYKQMFETQAVHYR